MTNLLIEREDYDILKSILQKYPYKFYAYGSRVKGTAKRYSDLDLCYQEDIAGHEVEEIKELLEKSDLSLIVELVSWKNMRPAFRENIAQDLTLI